MTYPTQKELQEEFHYDEATKTLTRKKHPNKPIGAKNVWYKTRNLHIQKMLRILRFNDLSDRKQPEPKPVWTPRPLIRDTFILVDPPVVKPFNLYLILADNDDGEPLNLVVNAASKDAAAGYWQAYYELADEDLINEIWLIDAEAAGEGPLGWDTDAMRRA